MTTMVALLRAVNVGGRNKLPMDRFRGLLEELGFRRPATYIQSGNAVFDADLEPQAVSERVKAALEERFAITTPVLVRTSGQIAAIVSDCPFAGRELDSAKVAVTFLEAHAPEDLTVPQGHREEAIARGREVWVYYPEGMGKSRLDRSAFWKPLKGSAMTTRNLRTVEKLAAMAAR
ncbi:DUF1697 domain-containing protein [Salininema proteolyticum]|uniref:DUF1697 domain-containing protein n=1 Tax=Salininema proteolyticum TaxID=1607685 RepID=A0ABV8U4C4_9ACTN